MKKSRVLSAACASLLLLPAISNATLIGLSGLMEWSYYEIDPATGSTTLLSESDGISSGSGLSFIDGNLYASDIYGYPGSVSAYDTVSVDLSTGNSTFLSTQDDSNNWHGLASNDASKILYSIDISDNFKLKSLALNGTVTTIGSGTGIAGRGMAYDDSSGVLYATDSASSIYTVDTSTGLATFLGATGVTANALAGLAYDEDANILYMVTGNGSSDANLYTINTSSGNATTIGSTGVNTIDGLAWVTSVPIPPALYLFGSGLLGLVSLARRKKA